MLTQSKWIFLVLLACLMGPSNILGQIILDDQIDLSEASGKSGSPIRSVTASGDNVYLAWQAAQLPFNMLFARSKDGGRIFEPPQAITRSSASDPFVGVANDVIHLVFRERLETIWYCRSVDGGDSFQCWMFPSQGSKMASMRAAVSGNNVYIAWDNRRQPDERQVYLLASTDRGDTFSFFRISDSPTVLCALGGLTAVDDKVYLTYLRGGRPFFVRGTVDKGVLREDPK